MPSTPAGSVVITMAGIGRRFTDAGYVGPKYRLVAHGRTLFWWSMIGLEHLFATARFVFVARAEDRSGPFLADACRVLGIHAHALIELDDATDGQATTAHLALPECSLESPLSIFNIDTHLSPGALGVPPADCDGWIPCFPGAGDHWSFVRLAPSGLAVEVREKQRIAPHATVGFYWFRSARMYRDAYAAYYDGLATPGARGERYVAPLYNQLIADGADVRITTMPDGTVTVLGTPAELRLFQQGSAPSIARTAADRAPGT